jgi:sulfate transport system substrate-binding protein
VLDEETYPTPQTLFTIADLGGWDQVSSEFFDREDGIFADIQRELGEPTE